MSSYERAYKSAPPAPAVEAMRAARSSDSEREEEAGVTAGGARPQRLLIYQAALKIQVEQLATSVIQVEEILRQVSGFIENRSVRATEADLRIRIPVAHFRPTLERFEKLGQVTERNLTADDVTREFQDTVLRLATLERVRDRYYALLKAAQKPRERLDIVKEINRITEEIDSLKERQKFLSTRAALATLDLRLRAVAVQDPDAALPSPFGWIAAWNPELAQSESGATGCWLLEDAPGFFRSSSPEDSGYQLATPEGVRIRALRVAHEPRAGVDFWQKALDLEWQRRGYTISDPVQVKGQTYQVAVQLPGFGSRKHALLFVDASGARIEWIEAFFPDEKLYSAHVGQVKELIAQRRKSLWPLSCFL